MQFSIDDLPAPLGPMMARISPFAMSKLMSDSAFTPPNERLMFSTASRTSLKERERLMSLPGARHSSGASWPSGPRASPRAHDHEARGDARGPQEYDMSATGVARSRQ